MFNVDSGCFSRPDIIMNMRGRRVLRMLLAVGFVLLSFNPLVVSYLIRDPSV